jgi:16S rRNA (cytosine967-C5)-methyltransferase
MAAGTRSPADPARRAAHDVLTAVSTRDAYANLLLSRSLRDSGLTGPDAALATELVYGTLRHRGSYDAIIGLCADRGLDQIDPAVLDALRMGTHQLLGMRIKPHAAVATTVDLAVAVAGRRPAGFVNAVLRRIAPRDLESWLAIAAPDWALDPVGHLAVTRSHPRWIITALAQALGEDIDGPLEQTQAALAADDTRPVVHLAAAPGRASQAELVGAGAVAAAWSPYGAYLSHGDPGRIPAVAQGRAGVQDEASQLATLALVRAARTTTGHPSGKPQSWEGTTADGPTAVLPSAEPSTAEGAGPERPGPERPGPERPGPERPGPERPGPERRGPGSLGPGPAGPGPAGGGHDPGERPQRWLDLCAGPGGKTRLLAGLAAEQGAKLLASDVHHHRAKLAARAIGGMGGTGVVTADGLAPPWRPESFDLVLADVPCSGLGSLRRRPEARWRRTEQDVDELGELQRGLLAAAIAAARPGGVVGYVTCSPHLGETVAVVDDALAAHDEVVALDAPALLAEVPDLRCRPPGDRYAQFWPHRHGTDAIFVAILRKSGAA